MATDDAGQTDLDIDLVTASLRADTSDLRAFVEALAAKLEDAMPGAVSVERRREGMFGPKQVRRIALEASSQRLELRADGASIQTRWGRLSGGIVLKSEELSTDEWLRVLGKALADQARISQTTRQALERLLNE
ncbi:MAG TPA: hypothetical protein VHW96_04465 [Solirubrobacteraceae bacterium]|jgi:hypothetical protein|nr:hypothetical protein [Solirubrobacteraceae bacterium]